MRLFRQLLLISLSFIAVAASAQNLPRLGLEYTVLDRPQPVDAGKKVEITEFFGYFCPACNAFEPYLEAWIKKQGDRIVVKRVHVNFHELVTQQKLFYTLEAMGKVNEYQLKTFNAFHVDRNRLSTDAEVMKYVEKVGLDKKKFADIYSSFAIQSKLSRAAQLMADYKISGVPTVVIDGRFVVSPADLNAKSRNPSTDPANHAGLKVMDWVVDKVYQEKNPVTVAPAAPVAATKKK
jgi:thiol:disulfide interchange protein DsbA